jgi:5-formyltetrahydrofolate cyclo-ligase
MTKQELRKVYLQKRLLLSETEYKTQNFLLRETFFKSVDLANIKIIHTFLPISKNHEPDTALIINQVKKNHPAMSVTIPRINVAGEMTSYILDESKLETNSWGIPEPKGGTVIPPTSIYLILVP